MLTPDAQAAQCELRTCDTESLPENYDVSACADARLGQHCEACEEQTVSGHVRKRRAVALSVALFHVGVSTLFL